jgi:predicted alpha/beta-fold hydrolase
MHTHTLNFRPFRGLASSHLQMILPNCRALLAKNAPPSKEILIALEKGAYLSCKVSTPPNWQKSDQTVILVHGMGGSDSSTYMIRISRKLYAHKTKVIRVNLRGSGSGIGLSKLPYHAGNSDDLLKVVQFLKEEAPLSEITLIGVSLGGNTVLKLSGELGSDAKDLVKQFIAVCAPIDLAQTVDVILEKQNRLYHSYYLKSICRQAQKFIPHKISSLYEFDDFVTAPLWGYKSAAEYYEACSSIRVLESIEQSTHLLFARDDPFIRFDRLQGLSLPSALHVHTTEQGSHVGFLGPVPNSKSPYWMDHLLLNWVNGDFTSNFSKTHSL